MDDEKKSAAAKCLYDLTQAIHRGSAWFKYLPILGCELLHLAPYARMGTMSHAVFAKRLAVVVELLQAIQPAPLPKGKPGRRGYPREALEFASDLRRKYPLLKSHNLWKMCREKFSEDDLPPDANSFRSWLNRKRSN